MYAPSSSGASGHAQRSHRSRISRAIVLTPSLRFVEQLASDQHPADFRGPGADLVELRVAPQAPGRELVDVAISPQRLDRLAGHPGCFLGCIEYRTRGV